MCSTRIAFSVVRSVPNSASEKVSLKEIEKARSERRKQVRAGLSTRAAMVDRYVEVHHAPPPAPKTVVAEPAPVEARPQTQEVHQ